MGASTSTATARWRGARADGSLCVCAVAPGLEVTMVLACSSALDCGAGEHLEHRLQKVYQATCEAFILSAWTHTGAGMRQCSLLHWLQTRYKATPALLLSCWAHRCSA